MSCDSLFYILSITSLISLLYSLFIIFISWTGVNNNSIPNYNDIMLSYPTPTVFFSHCEVTCAHHEVSLSSAWQISVYFYAKTIHRVLNVNLLIFEVNFLKIWSIKNYLNDSSRPQNIAHFLFNCVPFIIK